MKMKSLELLDGIIKHTESSGGLVAQKGRNLQVLVSENWDELELSWTITDDSEGRHRDSEPTAAVCHWVWGRGLTGWRFFMIQLTGTRMINLTKLRL